LVTQRRCYVVAEAGVNHNGSLDLALQLIDAAAEAGADAVKFQTFRAETLVGAGVGKAEYQQRATGSGDQRAMLESLELSYDDHAVLYERCASRGIEFLSTPFDEDAVEFLVGLGMRRIKIASGELTNRPFIELVASKGLPVILSTGMAELAEVAEAIEWIRRARPAATVDDALILLHCTSNYPTALADVNLRAMSTMARTFGLRVGYSDHTVGVDVAPVAVALGAEVIEKHFTLDRSLPGPDHMASLEVPELRRMIDAIRSAELVLGDGIKAPRPSEVAVRDLVRRSVAARRELPAGHVLGSADLTCMRPGTGIPPKALASVVGRSLRRPVRAGALIMEADLV
jgi:N,N'-diacetyllegionaminate synthase